MKIIVREWDIGKEIVEKLTAAGSILIASAVSVVSELAVGSHGQKFVVDTQVSQKAKWADQDGWVSVLNWAYASGTTITVPAGALTKYSVGMKFKLTSNSVVLYGYIIGIADTLLTVAGDPLTNFTFFSCAVSGEANPFGFPQWFNYTPTGISAANITLSGRFMVTGRRCFVDFKGECSGAITYTSAPTLPIPASSGLVSSGQARVASAGVGGYLDAPTTAYVPLGLAVTVIASGTTFSILKASDGTVIAATVPITWANGDIMEAHFSYEI